MPLEARDLACTQQFRPVTFPRCVSWEWDLDSGACALSELGTRPSVGPPTFSAVVGTVQPLLASEAQAFRWVEGGL